VSRPDAEWVANTLLCGIVERGLHRGVDTITIDTNWLWLLGLAQLHLTVTPLGLPRMIGNEAMVGVNASFNDTRDRLRDMRKASTRRLAEPTIEACKVA
jgi:N-acyl-L-homoserine lactone synthetase